MTTTISIRYRRYYNINNVESELTNYGIYNTVIVFIVRSTVIVDSSSRIFTLMVCNKK